MTHNFDTYFKRLDIDSTEISLTFVQELQKKHIATFSFNNIAVLLGKTISLDMKDIVEKIVTYNLGGYCFEHNALMFEVLKSLGFDVRILLAKVLNNQDIDMPRTHRITLLKWENEEYIVDVGFGAMTPPIVLKIGDSKTQEGYRLVEKSEKTYQLEVLKRDSFFVLYRFDLAEYTQADCVMGNFYSCSHPNAVFVNNFVIALRLPKLTLSFQNGVLHKIQKSETQVTKVQSVEQLMSIINDEFFIPLEYDECKKLYETSKK